MILINILIKIIMKKNFLSGVKSVLKGFKDTIPLVSTIDKVFIKKETPNAVFTKIDWTRLITTILILSVILYLLNKGFDMEVINDVIDNIKL